MIVQPGADFNALPDYPQTATVRCHNCGESITRSMQTITKMLEIDGYATCSAPCRDQVDQELVELLIMRGGAIC